MNPRSAGHYAAIAWGKVTTDDLLLGVAWLARIHKRTRQRHLNRLQLPSEVLELYREDARSRRTPCPSMWRAGFLIGASKACAARGLRLFP